MNYKLFLHSTFAYDKSKIIHLKTKIMQTSDKIWFFGLALAAVLIGNAIQTTVIDKYLASK
jgi:hypothetical protein